MNVKKLNPVNNRNQVVKKYMLLLLLAISVPLSIGYDVTESSSYGSVSVKNGANVVVERGNGVAIKNYFSVEKGATFEIK